MQQCPEVMYGITTNVNVHSSEHHHEKHYFQVLFFIVLVEFRVH
jgi:hypothetical protein